MCGDVDKTLWVFSFWGFINGKPFCRLTMLYCDISLWQIKKSSKKKSYPLKVLWKLSLPEKRVSNKQRRLRKTVQSNGLGNWGGSMHCKSILEFEQIHYRIQTKTICIQKYLTVWRNAWTVDWFGQLRRLRCTKFGSLLLQYVTLPRSCQTKIVTLPRSYSSASFNAFGKISLGQNVQNI